ncbi:hypothetical protein G7Z17_g4671 [Cylindrodendrum hubeiense]|uniref:NAD(P)-binding domain-containing protein n=1 Tax=Cylindrodendrum hubeiense TaxID=595255 RepID=A0A9P5LGY9_9HYPO|nr:hypothetical protein G7Z17_g4671 [Cylindrodendrum hubeiense]
MSFKTIAFFGASAGVGNSALKHTLAAGHQCIALLRTPSKLTGTMSPESNPNLRVVQGDVKNAADVIQCLTKADGNLVDEIVFTVGAVPDFSKMSLGDPVVCRTGMAAVLESLAKLRAGGATGRPLLIGVSTTGMSRFGRDFPLLLIPVYHWALKAAHQDKGAMENSMAESGEDFTVVRASLLVNGATDKKIRVGIEDLKTGREATAIGYTISREDAGKWIADNLLLKRESKYVNKFATITY